MHSPRLHCSRLICAAIMLTALVPLAQAHHSFAMFDMTKEVDIVGVVTEFKWTNPHIWIEVDVTGPNRQLQHWAIEGGGLPILKREGWTRETFRAGDKLTLAVHPRKDGTFGGSLVGVILADGRHLGGGAIKPQ